MVLEFLNDLETSRGNTVRTRNARLAAVQTFFRYVAGQEPSWPLRAARFCLFPERRRFVLYWVISASRNSATLLAQVDRLAQARRTRLRTPQHAL